MTAGNIQYCFFETSWGYFGLLAQNRRLLRTCLPVRESDLVRNHLISNIQQAWFNDNLLPKLQQAIKAYYQGKYVDFSQVDYTFSGFTPSQFTCQVLGLTQNIAFAKTLSYGKLAKMAGYPGAGRAVGNIMAKNPLPLIIPCHRIITATGQLGGFSGPGGINTKRRMLQHEKAVLSRMGG